MIKSVTAADSTWSGNKRHDVVVVGSGGGGLVAALRAADAGHRVLLLERSPVLGGTTAVSGGVLWAPQHHLMASIGATDSIEDATAYLTAASRGTMDGDLVHWFVATAPAMVRYLTDEAALDLVAIPRPDYHSSLPGAARGRGLESTPLDVRAHAGLEPLLRTPTYFPPMTIIERDRWQGGSPELAILAERAERGIRTLGGALVGRLVLAAAARGIGMVTEARARRLILDEDRRVRGVTIETPSGETAILAEHAVVLASGGFEWSSELQREFLPHPVVPVSPPYNEGDGLVMGIQAGASLKGMAQVWGVPVIQAPDHMYDGRPSARVANVELTLPGSIMVNRHGDRFVNEALNYYDLAKAFDHVDPDDGALRNQPAWMVFDARYRRSYPLAGTPAGVTTPPWVHTAATLADLSTRIAVDPSRLEATIRAFNRDAEAGSDTAFHRGDRAQDRHLADHSWTPNPSLGPISEPPFFALPIHSGALGTAGGLRTDILGRVLDRDSRPITGLFAAGNVTANLFGDTYPGAGATITAAMVRGYAIGDALADRSARSA